MGCCLGSDAIFFPEWSVTGYEPILAHGLSTTPMACLSSHQTPSDLAMISWMPGGSAALPKDGMLAGQLDGSLEGPLIFDTDTGSTMTVNI